MLTVEEMRAARYDHAVLLTYYLRFSNRYKFACFFEGPDDRYYYFNLLKYYIGENFLPLDCGGKDNLLKLLPLVKKDKKNTRRNIQLLFFLDGDYCNKEIYKEVISKNSKELFVLDSYSFENYYCTVEAFKKIFFREFGVGYESDEMNYFSREYLNWCKKLESNYLIINQCFYIIRLVRRLDVSLDKILKRNLMRYDQSTGILTANSISYDYVADILGVPTFTKEEIEEASSFFVGKNLIYYGRGHNQIWLIEAFLKSLYRQNAANKLRLGEKIIRFNCHRDVSDEVIAHCEYAAEKPESLINFIKNASEEVRVQEMDILLNDVVTENEIENAC